MSTEKGREAERAACRYLKRQGYTILDCNKRLGRGELDIVALYEEILAFIEVKAHKNRDASLTAMHADKCERFVSAANTWLGLHSQYGQYQCRFDLMIVTPRHLPLMGPKIEHMEDIMRL